MKNEQCMAGFAQLDITPPLDVRLGGYYNVRLSKGVLDPLYVRAIAFREGEKTAVLLVLDLVGMYGPTAIEWPPKIAELLGLPTEAVIVCCTHTHTGPVVHSYREPYDEQYDAWLYRRLCDAARIAIDDLKPVTDVRGGETETVGLTHVRRYFMTDGTVQTNPAFNTPEARALLDRPACDSDNSLRLIRILRQDGPELVLINFQVHPDCIGGEYVSADFPGAVCARVETVCPGVHCIFLNGCEGQMVRTDRSLTEQKYEKGHAGAMAFGADIADQALTIYHSVPSTGMTGLSFGQRFVHAKTKRGMMPMEDVDRIITLYETDRKTEIHPNPKMAFYLAAQGYSIRDMEKQQIDYYDLPVTGFAFCGAAFLGIPGEPFNEIGKHIRANSPFPITSVCCQANGNYGYYPTAEAFDQGGYEPHNTRLLKGVGEQLMDAGDAVLASL